MHNDLIFIGIGLLILCLAILAFLSTDGLTLEAFDLNFIR